MNKTNPIQSEVVLSFDTYKSQENFNENFTGIEKNWRHDYNVWLYTQWNQEEKPEFSHLFTINGNSSKINLRDLIDSSGNNWHEESTRDELINEVYSCFEKIEEFREYANDNNVKFKENFTEFITRGYGQGDYATVIVMKSTDYQPSQQEIDNYFWDAPIHGNITIQNREFDLWEINEDIPEYLNYPQDENWLADQILIGVKNTYKHAPAIENILASVKEAIPTTIKYLN